MRRIAALLSVVAFVAGFIACSADAPTPTPPTGTGDNGSGALQVRLFTNNANPTAGFCSQVQAIVTLNGNNVPDGTSVVFSTAFGTFQQNGLSLVSVVTQSGIAVTAVCSTAVGVARIRASATVGGQTGSSTLNVSFQPSAQSVPFFAFCNPSSGPNTGGSSLTISGGRFFGDASSTRVLFTVFGITREGVVQTVTATTLTVLTPAFPEAMSPSVPVDIAVTFGTNSGVPVTLAVPNCFVYGTAEGDQPTITAVLPSTGSNDGGTRVTIIGSGFVAPLQVFFGSVEAPPPVSVTYNQIVVLSPPATGPGFDNLNRTVDIRVHNVTSGKDSAATSGDRFTFVTQIRIFSLSNGTQNIDALSPVTIFGQGFSSPVAISLAGIPATPISVSATELVAMPSVPLMSGCTPPAPGPVSVTNINTGDSATSTVLFTYVVTNVVIGSISPNTVLASTGGSVTISGSGFPANGNISAVTVTIGGAPAIVTSVSASSISVTVQSLSVTPPACGSSPPATVLPAVTKDVTVTNLITGCSATAAQSFTFTAPCL
ncbi:MAG: IPT/TIG domain-containing protein [Thermoanaerobaculia bacterium]